MSQAAATARYSQLIRRPKSHELAIKRGQAPLPLHIEILTDRGQVKVRATDMHATARQAGGASSFVTLKTLDALAPRVERVRETANPEALPLIERLTRIGTVRPIAVGEATVTCVEPYAGCKQLTDSGINLADLFVYQGYNGLARELKLREGTDLPRFFPSSGRDKALACTDHRYVTALLYFLNRSMRFDSLRLLTREEADVFFADLSTATRAVKRRCVWLQGKAQAEHLPLYDFRGKTLVAPQDKKGAASPDARVYGARVVFAIDGIIEGLA